MSNNIQIIFAELEISSSVTLRIALSGWDITYDGNTYLADDTFVEVGNVRSVLDFENTPVEITLNASANSEVMAAVNGETYRYGDAIIYKGRWSTNSDKLVEVKVLKGGFIDSHSDPALDGTVKFLINSYSALATRGRDDVTAQVVHNNRLKDGAYGEANKTVTDTAFQNTAKDFGNVTLGATRANSYREHIGGPKPCDRRDHWLGWNPIYQTVNVAATAGARVNNAGESFHTPVAYGRTKVNYGMLDAFNPTQAQVTAKYGSDWNSGVSLVSEATKYLTLVVAVSHGPIDSCQMFSNHSDTKYDVLASAGADKQTTFIKDGDDNKIAAITMLRGSYDQTGFGSDNLDWRVDARGVGISMAMITMVAWKDWPDGIPDFTFIPDTTKIRVLSNSAFSTGMFKTNKVGEVIADYLTNKPYGLGLPESAIDISAFHAANNANSGLTNPLYPEVLRGSVTGAGSFQTFLQKMQDSCGMRLFEKEGKISIYFGGDIPDENITKQFYGDSHLSLSNCALKQSNSRARDIPNEATGKYFAIFDETGKSPDNIQNSLVVSDSELLAEDKLIKSPLSIEFDFVTGDGDTSTGTVDSTTLTVVRELLNLEIRKGRIASQRLEILTDYDEIKFLSLGDIVYVEEPRYNWTATGDGIRKYKIVEIEDDNLGRATLKATRFSNTIFGGIDTFSNAVAGESAPVVSNYSTTLDNFTGGEGTAGPAGADGRFTQRAYRDSPDQPAVGSGSSFDTTTGTVYPNDGWQLTPTPGTTNQRWFEEIVVDPGGTFDDPVAEVTRIGLSGTQAGDDSGIAEKEETDITFTGTTGGGFTLSQSDSLITGLNKRLGVVAYDGSTYLAAGSTTDGWFTSTDALSWSALTTTPLLNSSSTPNACFYANGLFFTGGSGTSTISVSSDLLSWTNSAPTFGSGLYGVIYVDSLSLFILLTNNGVYSSSDGASWDLRLSTSSLSDVAFGNGTLVVSGFSGKIFSSTDGITWTSRSTALVTGQGKVAFGNGTFLIFETSSDVVIKSSDGVTWSAGTSLPASIAAPGIVFGDNRFVVVSNDKEWYHSENGTTWTTIAQSLIPYSGYTRELSFDGSKFIGSQFSDAKISVFEFGLDEVTVTLDPSLSSSSITSRFTLGITGSAVDAEFKTMLDDAVTAGTLTGVTISAISGGGTKILNNVAGESTDVVVGIVGGTGSSLVVTETVVTQGEGVEKFKTTASIVVSSPHTPSSTAFSFGNDETLANAIIRVKDIFANGNITGYTISQAIGSNDFFEITSNTPGVENPDLSFTITQVGSGGDLVASTSVQTQGRYSTLTGWTTPVEDGPIGETGPPGDDASRTVNGRVYFTVAQATAPTTLEATSWNFTDGNFVGLTTNWTTSPQTIVASQSNSFWQAEFTVVEASFGGSQTITFGTIKEVTTFSEVLVTGGLAAGQSLKVGDISSSDTQITGGSGALFEADGDAFIGSATNNIVFDNSAGTFTVNGTIITANNIVVDGITLVGNGNVLEVGEITSSQVSDTGDRNISFNGNGTNLSSSGPGNAGDGADYTLSTAGNITVDVNARGGDRSGTGNGSGGDGGNWTLTSTSGNITITNLDVSGGGRSGIGNGNGGDGGNVTLNANSGCVTGNANVLISGGTRTGTGPGTPGAVGALFVSNSAGNVCAT